MISTNWQTKSSKVIIKNKYIEIREENIILPNNKKATYYVRYAHGFSLVVPYQNKRLYMVRQYRYAVRALSLEFPMGISEDKNPLDTAKTELKEETGIISSKYTVLGEFWIGAGRTNQMCSAYLAEDLKFEKAEPEEGELLELADFSIQEVRDMISTGEIKDGVTISAFYLFLSKYSKL